jgi:hypothetical protein
MLQFYTQVKNPKWANAEHTTIDCEVDFGHLNDEFVPFTANPTDAMEYSKTIFDECVAGQYGEIAEYVVPAIDNEAIAKLEADKVNKASALAKLAALGLTQDEVKALVG